MEIDEVEMNSVTSSNLRAIGYRDEELYVKFQGGELYCYHGVPKEVYEQLLHFDNAGEDTTVGKFFYREVRGKYRHEKLGG